MWDVHNFVYAVYSTVVSIDVAWDDVGRVLCLRGVLDRGEHASSEVVRHVAMQGPAMEQDASNIEEVTESVSTRMVNSISFGSPHVRCTPTWALSTCGEPNEVKKNPHSKKITALLAGQTPGLVAWKQISTSAHSPGSTITTSRLSGYDEEEEARHGAKGARKRRRARARARVCVCVCVCVCVWRRVATVH